MFYQRSPLDKQLDRELYIPSERENRNNGRQYNTAALIAQNARIRPLEQMICLPLYERYI